MGGLLIFRKLFFGVAHYYGCLVNLLEDSSFKMTLTPFIMLIKQLDTLSFLVV
jgi:hypothetical protein